MCDGVEDDEELRTKKRIKCCRCSCPARPATPCRANTCSEFDEQDEELVCQFSEVEKIYEILSAFHGMQTIGDGGDERTMALLHRYFLEHPIRTAIIE